jgi:integrase
MQNTDMLGKHLLLNPVDMIGLSSAGDQGNGPTLGEALAMYLELKGPTKGKTFFTAATRSCGYLVEVCGEKTLPNYTRADAIAFRNELMSRNLTGSTITRIFGSLRAVINFSISEYGIEMQNPFSGIYLDRKAGVKERKPIPAETISAIQQECKKIDDEMRWLLLLLSDTGMRLAEGAGLLIEDIVLDSDIPHIRIMPHPWRRLKTLSSAREVPLVNEALWAARRIKDNSSTASPFAFPRYNKTDQTNSNSASAALNKWVKPYLLDGCSVHSLRHAMRDRMRAIECPSDIVDQIGGWTTQGVGHGYGDGYPLEVLHRWMTKL